MLFYRFTCRSDRLLDAIVGVLRQFGRAVVRAVRLLLMLLLL